MSNVYQGLEGNRLYVATTRWHNMLDIDICLIIKPQTILFSVQVNEFVKIRSSLNLRWNFSYLRTKDDVEIDLIIEKPRGKPIFVEIKSKNHVGAKDLSSLLGIGKDLAHEQMYLLSRDPKVFEIQNVRCLPWQMGLKEIFGL